jgi:FkbM family methyltransferase
MKTLKDAAVSALNVALPHRIKKFILHLSYHIAPSDFERFAHTYCIGPSMAVALESLAARGFDPRIIVDVGAYEGWWSEMAHMVWPNSRVIMIEPNPAKREKLAVMAAKLRGKVHSELLGARYGDTVRFNLMDGGSSVLRENSPVERVVEIRSLATLDSLALDLDGENNFLKIDVQGYELEVLRGATNSFKSFEAILLEVAIIEINEGAPLLHEVVAFMAERDFIASEVVEIHRRPLDQAMSQIDIVFVRKGSHLLADTRYS